MKLKSSILLIFFIMTFSCGKEKNKDEENLVYLKGNGSSGADLAITEGTDSSFKSDNKTGTSERTNISPLKNKIIEVYEGSSVENSDPLTDIIPAIIDDNVAEPVFFNGNQRGIVQNSKGIFIAYIKRINGAESKNVWRLVQLNEQAGNITIIYEGSTLQNFTPLLETNPTNSDLFVLNSHPTETALSIYHFKANLDYKNPEIHSLYFAGQGNHSMEYDHTNNRFFITADGENGIISLFDLSTRVAYSYSVWMGDSYYKLTGSSLVLDPAGFLYAGWTNHPDEKNFSQFDNIFTAKTVVNGRGYFGSKITSIPEWFNLEGKKLGTMFNTAEDGNATPVSPLEEKTEASSCLMNLLLKKDKLHYLFRTNFVSKKEGVFQRYLRIDSKTGEREVFSKEGFKGNNLSILSGSGFFASVDQKIDSPLYAVGGNESSGEIVVIASDDNGTTWYDYAKSKSAIPFLYISGSSKITDDRFILGLLTEKSVESDKLNIFKLKAGLSKARIKSFSRTDEKISFIFDNIKGHPLKIRFSLDGKIFSDYMTFYEHLDLNSKVLPSCFQLKSNIGTESEVFKIISNSNKE